MISLETAKKNIGNKVLYYVRGNRDLIPEEGVITSANDMFIFVRYGSDTHSKATNPEDLFFI